MNTIEKRTGKGYEVQCYNYKGNASKVYSCENLEEVAKVLISICNNIPSGNFPTVWLDGVLIRD